jgi:Na+-transporting methylmalonyl-CoA/oxaloacetate decarboxylase gamma subunit
MITSPLIIVAWVLTIIYCLMAFIFLSIKSFFVFFAGRTIFSPLKEDIQAKKALETIRKSHNPLHKANNPEEN